MLCFVSIRPQILEDSWVVLDQENFGEFAKHLGVRDGRMRRSAFQAKYEGETRKRRAEYVEAAAMVLHGGVPCKTESHGDQT